MRSETVTTALSQLGTMLLPYCSSLPADELPSGIQVLGSAVGMPASVEAAAVLAIARRLETALSPDLSARVHDCVAAIEEEIAAPAPDDGPANFSGNGHIDELPPEGRTPVGRDASALEVIDELARYVDPTDEKSWTQFEQLRERALGDEAAARPSVALVAAAVVRDHVEGREETDRRRLLALAIWAIEQERAHGDQQRTAQRLNQLSGVLDRVPESERDQVLRDCAPMFAELIGSGAKQKFLHWVVDTLPEETEPTLAALRVAAQQRLSQVPQGPTPSTASTPPRPPATAGLVGTPADIALRIRNASGRSWNAEQCLGLLRELSCYLDPKHRVENDGRFDGLAGGDVKQGRVLAGGVLVGAAWAVTNRAPGSSRAVQPDHVGLLLDAAGLLASVPGSQPRALRRALAIVGLHSLAVQTLQPAGYLELVEVLSRELADDSSRAKLRQEALDDLEQYLRESSRRGTPFTPTDAETWVDSLVSWGVDISPVQRGRLATLLKDCGAPDSIGLHQLTDAGIVEDRADTSIFGPRDEKRFEEHYQQGRPEPIGELLHSNRERLLAVVDAELSDERQTQFLPPARRVKVTGNQFTVLAKKAERGTAREAREAYDGFDRLLRSERRPHARDILAEWKAFAEFRANSVFAAEPLWREAAENGTASKEVLWNLAVRRKQTGSPVGGLQYLRPLIDRKQLPLSYVRFACALAVAELRKPATAQDSKDAEDALAFILGHAACLPTPSVQLLWFWAAYTSKNALDDTANQALVRYNDLIAQPFVLPTVEEVMRLPAGPARTAEVERIYSRLEATHSGAFRVTWRLWIGEFARENPAWWPAWDKWTSACDADGDAAGAVDVLREAADSATHTLKRNGLPQPQRDKAANFLRSAVNRLLRFQRDLDRGTLLTEIRDRYVLPFPELQDGRRAQNKTILARLGLLDPERDHRDDQQEPRPGADRVWLSLQPDLGSVRRLDQLVPALRERVDAALAMEKQRSGAHALLLDDVSLLVEQTWQLQSGLRSESAAERLLDLGQRLQAAAASVASAHLDQLVGLVRMLERVVQAVTRDQAAVPALEIRLAKEWIGWPDDVGTSSIPVEITFPGPGSAESVSVVGGWAIQPYRPRGEIVLDEVRAGTTVCCALELDAPPAGALDVRLDSTYRWGPVSGVNRSVQAEVPRGDFAGLLQENGVQAQEFPNPYVVNVPLSRAEVTSSLFQGREAQLQEVRRNYRSTGFPPLPLCFYGLRKTGKTSLLRRVLVDLVAADVVPLEVDVVGLRGDVMSLGELCYSFLDRVMKAAGEAGANLSEIPLPEAHVAPLTLISPFFDALASSFSGRKIVVLLDEFQYLLTGGNADSLLDVLRPVHEQGRCGFIMFANQGLDPSIKLASQLSMRSIRVDFLTEGEVSRLIESSVGTFGVRAHPSALARLFEQAAGQPNFTAMLARGALSRLNSDRRNVLTTTDIDAAVDGVLATPGEFAISWFSRQNVSPDEVEAAIGLANEDSRYAGMTVADAQERLGISPALARDLEAKRLVEFRQVPDPNLRVRGRLLWSHLRRQVSVPLPPIQPGSQHAVGLFVDFENIRSYKPGNMSYREFGQRLIDFAATIGDVRSRNIAVASWNTRDDWDRVKAELQGVGFLILHEPESFSPSRREEKRDVADFLLHGQATEHVREFALTDVIVATGDGDLLIVVNELLQRNVAVRLVYGARDSLSGSFEVLEDQRRQEALGRGLETDFQLVPLSDLLG